MHKKTKYSNHPYLILYLQLSINTLVPVFYAHNNAGTKPERDGYALIFELINFAGFPAFRVFTPTHLK